MRVFFFFLLFMSSLNASKILSYNIYDRTDRSDVMITFDTPYEGIIKQSTTASKIIIRLNDASIESSKLRKTNSSFLHSIHIVPMENQTQIVAAIGKQTNLQVSKTSDAYGLRLRFSAKKAVQKSSVENNLPKPFTASALPTKKSDNLSTSYYIVVTILIIGIFILFILKKKITNKTMPTSNKTKKEAWLFQENKQVDSNTTATATQESSQVSIRFQKALDEENSVVMLDFGAQSYLVLMGKSNILLDKFTDNKPTTQEDFNTILQSRHEELENFLGQDNRGQKSQTESSTEALQAYKERAASMLYEV